MGWGSGPLMPSSGSAFRERGREGGREMKGFFVCRNKE